MHFLLLFELIKIKHFHIASIAMIIAIFPQIIAVNTHIAADGSRCLMMRAVMLATVADLARTGLKR